MAPLGSSAGLIHHRRWAGGGAADVKARGRAVPSKNVKVGVEEGASLVRLRPLCGLRGVETSLFGRGARGGNPSSEDDRSPSVINPLGRLKRFASTSLILSVLRRRGDCLIFFLSLAAAAAVVVVVVVAGSS